MNLRVVAPIESTATLTVYQLPDAPYRLKKPLLLEIERDESGAFVVSEPTTGIFHYDSDLGKALTSFFRVFVDEFEFLRNHQAELSAALVAELDRLQQLLLPVES